MSHDKPSKSLLMNSCYSILRDHHETGGGLDWGSLVSPEHTFWVVFRM